MKKSVLVAGIASLGLAASALAGGPVNMTPATHNGFYFGTALGVSVASGTSTQFVNLLTGAGESYNQALNTGFDVALRLGYHISQVRLEAAATVISNTFKNDSNESWNTGTFMFNGYYDFNTGTKWTPFVGAGMGAAVFNTQTDDNTGPSDTEFAAQGIAGVAYKLNSNLSLDASYHYVGYANKGGSHNHLINVGLNYFFA